MFAPVETVTRLAVLDVDAATVDTANTAVAELSRVVSWANALEARLLVRLRDLNRDASRDLSDSTGVSAKTATGRVKTATALSQLPVTLGALETGEITPEHASVMTKAVADNPRLAGKLKANEAELLAGRGTVDDLAKRVREFVTDHDTDPNEKALRQQSKRKGWFFDCDDDMGGIGFQLPPEWNDEAKRLLILEAQRLYREHENTDHEPSEVLFETRYRHYLADAFMSLIRKGANPATGTMSRPTGTVLAVHVQGAASGQFVNGTPVNLETVRRMACTNGTIPVVVDDKGAVLYHGRNVRLATPAQRAALQVMFTGCVICGADWLWCHVHHVISWDDLGGTDLGNLVPVCGHRCHNLVHEGGWKLKIPKLGLVEIYTPNGHLHQTIHANAPPPRTRPKAA